MEVCHAGELYDIIEYFRPGALYNWEAMGGHELYQTVALQGRCTGLVTVASEQLPFPHASLSYHLLVGLGVLKTRELSFSLI